MLRVVAAPELVGREKELLDVAERLRAAAEGKGGLLCYHGAAGAGKTRLLDEALKLGRAAGFETAAGTAFSEAVTLYQPWSEALGRLKLEGLLQEEPPPKLLGLYLLSGAGVLVARAEREGLTVDADLFASMSSAVGDFLAESLPGAPSGENLLRLAHGSRGICVVREAGFALTSVFEGREGETFLQEMRRLAAEIDRAAGAMLRGWDGDAASVAGVELPLRWTLESGRWEGDRQALEGPARKFNLFENVRAGLERASTRRPILIVLDDLQWADPSSLALLRYLARNLKGTRAQLLAAYREEEVAARPDFAAALGAMVRDGLLEDRSLPPLSEEESEALCERMVGASGLPASLLELVACETECNPLFIREVLEGLIEEGTISAGPETGEVALTRPVEKLKVPGRVRDVVAQRLRRLKEEERALIDAAAVCGSRFDGALVARVMGEPEAKVLRGLNALSRGHALVRPEGRQWAFEHPVLREVVYGEISLDLRELYHRQAGEALRAQGAPEAVVGDHLASAHDPRAVEPLRAAAGKALERGAPEEAARYLARALEVAPPSARAPLEEERGSALELAGRYAEALEAISRGEAEGGPRTRLLRRRLGILEKLGRLDEALALASAAAANLPPAEASLLFERHAVLLMRLGRIKEARMEAEEALRWLPEGEPIPRAGALQVLAECAWYEGRYEEGMEREFEVTRLLEAAGDRRGLGAALSNLGSTFHQLGDLDRALENYTKSRVSAEAIGDRFGLSAVFNNIGLVHLDRGQFEEARRHFTRSIEIAEAIGDLSGMGAALQNLGSVELTCGLVGPAAERFEKALGVARQAGDFQGAAAALVNLGAARHLEGRNPEALALFDEAVRGCRERDERQVLTAALIESVAPKLEAGDLGGAHAAASEGAAFAQASHLGLEEAQARRAIAQVLAAEKKVDAARVEFAGALARFEGLGAGHEVAETHLRWGLFEKAVGEAAESARRLGLAAAAFKARGMPLREREARRALEGL